MKVVILAGGLGTRLAEETEVKPKPMVEVGGRPILWHIMKHFAHFGFREFFIALGYRGDVIKRYFLEYHALNGNTTIDLRAGQVRMHDHEREDWVVHLLDTGDATNTGGRLRRLEPWLRDGPFIVTYGDGIADLDLNGLLSFHRQHGRMVTVTAVRPPARFGAMHFDGDLVAEFTEKAPMGEGWINGGYLVCEPPIFNYLSGDDSTFEIEVLEQLAAERQLAAYRHPGFWQCMDTLRDKRLLESLWQSGRAPWRMWS